MWWRTRPTVSANGSGVLRVNFYERKESATNTDGPRSVQVALLRRRGTSRTEFFHPRISAVGSLQIMATVIDKWTDVSGSITHGHARSYGSTYLPNLLSLANEGQPHSSTQ